MKPLLPVLVLLFATSAFGAEGTQRYFVAMKPERGHAAHERKAVELAGRDFEDLRYLDGFVATLTDADAAKLRNDPSVRYVESAETLYRIAESGPSIESHPINA